MSKRKVRRAITVKGKHGTYTAHRLVAADANHAETTEHRALKQQSSLLGRYLRTAGLVVTLGSRAVVAAIHKRHSGLQAMNPWEAHHTKDVDTRNSQLGGMQKFYGTSGPGSDHSLFAHMVGHLRDYERLYLESLREVPKGTREHALARQDAASSAVGIARMDVPANPREPPTHQRDFDATLWANSTGAATSGVYSTLLRNHGLSNVSQVPQNPNKWVR
jgi:hypothetical protein